MHSMTVKWERRNAAGSLNRKSYLLNVVLVENYQENGKIKEKLIDRLGTIEERFLNSKARDMKAFHQGLFWAKVDNKLDRLKLSSEKRNKIEAEISERVPRPDEQWSIWAVTCVPRFDL
jgi:hypothetical protein